MNNFTFGDDNITYYETIAGGAGAGPGWQGRSGVHTHMTNTRITDPEILERRYPVVLHDFSLRQGSGGAGKFKGGDGVIREVRTVVLFGGHDQVVVAKKLLALCHLFLASHELGMPCVPCVRRQVLKFFEEVCLMHPLLMLGCMMLHALLCNAQV